VKFLDLINFSRKLGAISLVTGHYIKKKKIKNEWALYVPEDKKRDQSYFLFSIKPEDLDFIDFPLGDFTKNEIRDLAKSMQFHLHDKADSQDICFVPEGDYKEFIKKNIKDPVKGEIVDLQNNVIETHEGIYNFTIGQRRGLGVSKEKPMYVKQIDSKNNRVIVAEKEEVRSREVFVKDINYLTEINNLKIKVRVRSTGKFLDASIERIDDQSVNIILDEEENAVSPGQACVFYHSDKNGTRLVGGGWIHSTN
jgi:tRNA-specific 2-thiouridylase